MDAAYAPGDAFAAHQLPASCVVYTAMFGDYETLREQPVAHLSGTDFVCYTDNPSLVSDTWRVKLVEAALPRDPIRSARLIKIAGHPSLADYSHSIWVDNRVTLQRDPLTICEKWLSSENADIALFEHSFRERVMDEFEAVSREGYDDPSRVYEQMMHYADAAPQVLLEKPFWTGLLVRRHTKGLNSAMERWQQHVLRYSRRDQLSINLVLAESSVRVHKLQGSNRESEFHSWPSLNQEGLNRKKNTRDRAFNLAMEPPLARVRAIERDSQDLEEAYLLSSAKKDELARSLQRKVDQLRAEVTLLKAQDMAVKERLTSVTDKLAERDRRVLALSQRLQRLHIRHKRLRAKVAAPPEQAPTSNVLRLLRAAVRRAEASAVYKASL